MPNSPERFFSGNIGKEPIIKPDPEKAKEDLIKFFRSPEAKELLFKRFDHTRGDLSIDDKEKIDKKTYEKLNIIQEEFPNLEVMSPSSGKLDLMDCAEQAADIQRRVNEGQHVVYLSFSGEYTIVKEGGKKRRWYIPDTISEVFKPGEKVTAEKMFAISSDEEKK